MMAENLILVVQRKLKASPEYLFDAWTKPELMLKWFHAGPNMTTPSAENDLKVGGKWRVVMHGNLSNKDYPTSGKYLVLDRPNKLVFTWHPFEQPDYETKVTLLFKKVSETETEMTLTHEGLRNEEDYKSHSGGWNGCADSLERFLAK